jgi:hypothetical protein
METEQEIQDEISKELGDQNEEILFNLFKSFGDMGKILYIDENK